MFTPSLEFIGHRGSSAPFSELVGVGVGGALAVAFFGASSAFARRRAAAWARALQ